MKKASGARSIVENAFGLSARRACEDAVRRVVRIR
jgi:hypothetical protein